MNLFTRRKATPSKRRTIDGAIVEDGRQLFWHRDDSFPGHIREARRAYNKRSRQARRGRPQKVAGLTVNQRAKRYRHLENVAARANTVALTRIANGGAA